MFLEIKSRACSSNFHSTYARFPTPMAFCLSAHCSKDLICALNSYTLNFGHSRVDTPFSFFKRTRVHLKEWDTAANGIFWSSWQESVSIFSADGFEVLQASQTQLQCVSNCWHHFRPVQCQGSLNKKVAETVSGLIGKHFDVHEAAVEVVLKFPAG